MMYNYDLIINDFSYSLDENKINNLITCICKELNISKKAEFSISFENKKTIHRLNKIYRNIDRSTDILTFVASDGMDLNNSFSFILGDMIICLEELSENCIYFNESNDRELLRLLVHGFLHLLGYDHKTNDVEKESMLIKQEILIEKLEKEIEPEKRSKLFV